MPGIRDDVELDLGPGLLQFPRGDRRGAGVVAPLDDDAGDAAQLTRIAEQLAFLEPAVRGHVVILDAGDRDRDLRAGEMLDRLRTGKERADVALPLAPGLGGGE